MPDFRLQGVLFSKQLSHPQESFAMPERERGGSEAQMPKIKVNINRLK